MTDGATDRAIDRITFPLVVPRSARAGPEQRHDFTASAVMKLSVRSPQFRQRVGGQRDIALLLSHTPIFLGRISLEATVETILLHDTSLSFVYKRSAYLTFRLKEMSKFDFRLRPNDFCRNLT